ncbi:MAG TPA: 1-(5-phosphoribosyl)-5-[(5-phosphoribosylamino)methylideneamino]imidazole-4-carboxamide isomerase [Solirubrobacterales bacterium]|nr:1-(5-phosphoribosyl)-5-[(5-phosphoribosylamino)methylideneamino]imidazole-4-carboxamide isomerase [Solirubrobacterales bacterium]
MILYPAIDIRGGQAVRLLQGDYERETAYDADPADAARRWADEGAEYLHVVDLDGAKAGEPRNLAGIERIASAVDCPIQVGGGLRDPQSVRAILDAGADRVVIGTAALRDPEFLAAMIEAHGHRIVVSVDARDGRVALDGWTEAGDVEIVDAVAALAERGVARFLCTAIEVDGTMEGPAIDQLTEIASATTSQIIASGGVGTLTHLESLAELSPANVEGVIVGRALYERSFTVAQAIEALAGTT